LLSSLGTRARNSAKVIFCARLIGAIVAGEGKFAISDRAKAAHVKNPTQQDRNSNAGGEVCFLSAGWRGTRTRSTRGP